MLMAPVTKASGAMANSSGGNIERHRSPEGPAARAVVGTTCSDLRTSTVVLENITVFGSDYLRMKLPLGSHYLRMSADYLRRAHQVENEAAARQIEGTCHRASPTARIRSASSRVRPASS